MALNNPVETDYNYLISMIANWLNRNDMSVPLIKDFISLAERKIFRQLRSPMNEKAIYITTASETDYITLPGDLLEIKDLIINGKDFKFKPYNIWINNKDCYTYTRQLGDIKLPTAVKADTKITLNYYFDASGMNDGTETNNVLRTCPDLYLYAALIQAESFLINDERITLWKSLYDVTLEEVNRGYKNMDYRGNLVIMEK